MRSHAGFSSAILYARKLLVVGEGSDHVVDMVRADSAGFQDVTAIEIDPRLGDLWVVTTGPTDGTGALHKLQLISGRVLSVFDASPELRPVRFADVTVTPSGVVLGTRRRRSTSARLAVQGRGPGSDDAARRRGADQIHGLG